MVNNSHSPITHLEENKKQRTYRDVKSADRTRQFQHITSQPLKQILHAVYNNILQNFPILQEDAGMAEEIYGPSV